MLTCVWFTCCYGAPCHGVSPRPSPRASFLAHARCPPRAGRLSPGRREARIGTASARRRSVRDEIAGVAACPGSAAGGDARRPGGLPPDADGQGRGRAGGGRRRAGDSSPDRPSAEPLARRSSPRLPRARLRAPDRRCRRRQRRGRRARGAVRPQSVAQSRVRPRARLRPLGGRRGEPRHDARGRHDKLPGARSPVPGLLCEPVHNLAVRPGSDRGQPREQAGPSHEGGARRARGGEALARRRRADARVPGEVCLLPGRPGALGVRLREGCPAGGAPRASS